MKYGTIIPLLGGMTLGNIEATGEMPSFFISYEPFGSNDQNIRDRFPEVPYILVDPETNRFVNPDIDMSIFEGVQFVSSVCPCAGLSMLNSGGQADANYGRGSDAVQNQWMYRSTRFILENIKPRVLWGENAPGLFSDMGKGVADNLYKIAQEHGYSFSIVKTNTKLHGIPQNRPRTFYFLWDSETAPMLNWYKRPMPLLADYLKQVPPGSLYHDVEEMTKFLADDPLYQYIYKTHGPDYRKVLKAAKCNSFFQFLQDEDRFEGVLKYLQEINHKYAKNIEYMIGKLDKGLGYWDWSVHIFEECTNATVSRNMDNTLHPTEERMLTLREYMHMMALPHDFVISGGVKFKNHIAQNVPVCTARDWTYEVLKYLDGGLHPTNVTDLRQDNNSQQITTKGAAIVDDSSDFISACIGG